MSDRKDATVALALLTDLTAAGFTLTADGHRLLVSPGAKLTTEQADAIRAHKPQLLALLRPIDPEEAAQEWTADNMHDAAAFQAGLLKLQRLHDDQEAARAARQAAIEARAQRPSPVAPQPGLFGNG